MNEYPCRAAWIWRHCSVCSPASQCCRLCDHNRNRRRLSRQACGTLDENPSVKKITQKKITESKRTGRLLCVQNQPDGAPSVICGLRPMKCKRSTTQPSTISIVF